MIQYKKMSVLDIYFHYLEDRGMTLSEEEKDLFGYFTQTSLSMEDARYELGMTITRFEKTRREVFRKFEAKNRLELSVPYVKWLEDVIDEKVLK